MKKILNTTFILLALIYLLIFILSNFLQNILILEIIVSFLPYLLVLNLVLIICILFISSKNQNIPLWMSKLSLFILIIFASTTAYFGFKVIRFSYSPTSSVSGSQDSDTMKIGFFNKLYNNKNYEEISRKIEDLNPDIMGFAELTLQDRASLEVLKKFPYSYVTDCKCDFTDIEVALYSNYPLEDVHLLDGKMSPILSARIKKDSKQYRFFVIHPPAPISTYDLQLRNEALKVFASEAKAIKEESIVLMGDFNTSPWSPSYISFLNNSPQLKDAAEGKGINFTWGVSILRTQIDHILVSRETKVKTFKVEGRYGSDHNMIVAEIIS